MSCWTSRQRFTVFPHSTPDDGLSICLTNPSSLLFPCALLVINPPARHHLLATLVLVVTELRTQDYVDELSLCHPPHDSICASSIASEVRPQGFEIIATIQTQPPADRSPALTAFYALQASSSASHRVRTRLDIGSNLSRRQQNMPGLHTIAALHRPLRERPEP